ncbi:major facilitator superfamily domain-containing protein [Cantharellus anzutake]|uniref:major facilitator superfamily domain-containing protein n=1 Tax=Cantharellus anzutake TaxID=1750568 RepID=UPI0019070218|nr:major facilitator superfamily domain-containing protein [Cantharellus anzutake]KAF8342314.1 major facilitator superfamily domain-containing protein [Cantharellus anzutake]
MPGSTRTSEDFVKIEVGDGGEVGLPHGEAPVQGYRVFKRRWIGLVALFLLNVASGMNALWFAAISVDTSKQFLISLHQVTWLLNVVNLVYIPSSIAVPPITRRYGIPSVIMAAGSWVRYGAYSHTLSSPHAYAIIFFGQFFSGFAQPWFQILGPKYSELWFDLQGRTTATAIIAIANPIGSALGELISPLIKDVRHGLLVLAIITSALSLSGLFVLNEPPIPPTFAGSVRSPSPMEVFRACVGKTRPGQLYMTRRQVIDFAIVTWLFGVYVAAANSLFTLVNEILAPHGYSSNASGNMGGAFIIAGIIGALVTSPLFDRVLTHHLGITTKILIPIIGVAWLSLIWDVRPHNYGGLYAVFVVMGVGSFILLPVALELGCEITSSPEASSSILWGVANGFSAIFVEVMDALREGKDASPPGNMRRSLIFSGVFTLVSAVVVFGLEARQARRELDVEKARHRAQN